MFTLFCLPDSSFDGNNDTTDEVQGPSQPPAPASQKAKKKSPYGKGKKNRSASGALENAMSSLHELYDRMETRDEKNLQKIEEREEQRRREDIDVQEKRDRWEHEQEERRIKEHREFMMQMIQMMRQPVYPPNYQSPDNWSGPSFTTL
ncbi:uncharacterized protein LOC117293239 [Asterias rubens]|uniref:uncharacterized protein LOC117293239 n=1 Tax=Asterias rubens TaxID=7604 RepID=UPI001454F0E0|nr:uncharacterized protein LOC117293239 [Asterias rubens]